MQPPSVSNRDTAIPALPLEAARRAVQLRLGELRLTVQSLLDQRRRLRAVLESPEALATASALLGTSATDTADAYLLASVPPPSRRRLAAEVADALKFKVGRPADIAVRLRRNGLQVSAGEILQVLRAHRSIFEPTASGRGRWQLRAEEADADSSR
jgi:hypothetical protein